MKSKISRILCYLMVAVIMSYLFTGCTGEKNNTKETANGNQEGLKEYPMKTDVTLTYWVPINTVISSQAKNMGETPFAQELEKKTGVKVKYIHPALGQENEQFNILLASGEIPDIIEYPWTGFPGGPERAISEGYIRKLNEIIDKNAPNLKKYLEAHKDIDKMVKTDSGSYYVFPFLRGDESLTVSVGPMIRKDWLTELGLEIPTTVEEWRTVLKVFKDKKNAEAPMSVTKSSLNNGFLMGAYGVKMGFYIDDGKVKYGPIEPEFKDFLLTFRQWYLDGIIDKNFGLLDDKTVTSNILSGKSGATIGFLASGMGKWLNAMKEKDPKYDLVGAPYPSLQKGGISKFGHKEFIYGGSGSAAITASCKNPEVAARFLDYAYSEKGQMLFNFGIEGTSYNMVNGAPVYTDEVLKNPKGLSVSEAMSKYVRSYNQGPFVQDKRFGEQYFSLPQQQEALKVWSRTEAASHNLPRVTPSMDESSEMSKIINEVNTYTDEMFFKFVMGAEPIDKFDAFVQQLKKLNIDRAIEIQQAALKRYEAR